MKIAIVQFNPVVGDLTGNADRIIAFCHRAMRKGAVAIVFPELAITGYPPEDLLFRDDFITGVEKELERISSASPLLTVIVGYPERADGALFNSVGVLRAGELVANYRKQRLPNYGVFDEKRYFQAGTQVSTFPLGAETVGLTICEDIWTENVCQQLKQAGATLIINLNASPFEINKASKRERTVQTRVSEIGLPIIYLNQVGGQDELVFDGNSFVISAHGCIVQRMSAFVEQMSYVEVELGNILKSDSPATAMSTLESIYQALVLGVRDYVSKNGFNGVVLGLSGGIDSALVLAVAVDALGSECIEVVLMPSKYTADMSNEDAIKQAQALGVKHQTIPIEPAVTAFSAMLAPAFEGLDADVTEENIQARSRGVLLMAIANKKRKILLTTGNKSEMAVGYATLYGDMSGGFAPIKDVPKMLVYALAKYRNEISPVIPERVITRAPSAELALDQKDEDSLPPYPVLDDILQRYIELDQSKREILEAGHKAAEVDRVLKLVEQNEYKRRQAPPGVKITSRAFGRERRFPMTSGFSKTLFKDK
ncbi:MAG: NAD+ synthase [Cycloclasticus sp. symbiont of Poecilosclerida sp. N]|nr:MAG: NAD+ synthase [Cycloclasticus sp. symbiont of Poecilosclerida sp. N]